MHLTRNSWILAYTLLVCAERADDQAISDGLKWAIDSARHQRTVRGPIPLLWRGVARAYLDDEVDRLLFDSQIDDDVFSPKYEGLISAGRLF